MLMFRKIAFVVFLFFVVLSLVFAFKSSRDVTTNSDVAYTAYEKGVELADQLYTRQACAEFEKAVAADSNFAMAYARLAGCYANLGFSDKSKDAFNRAYSLRDKVSDSEKMLLEMWQAKDKGDTTMVRALAHKYVDKYPNKREGYIELGAQDMEAGDYEAAIGKFLKVTKVDPEYANAYNMLGYLNYYLGRYDEALNYLEKYSQLAPDEANPHDSRGEILHALGRYQEAIAEFREAYNINPDFDYALEHMAFSYLELGKKSQVEYCFETLIEKAPSDRRRYAYYESWAQTLLVQQLYDSARAMLRLVLNEDPENLAAVYDMAYSYYLQKDLKHGAPMFDSLKVAWKKATEKEPYLETNREYKRSHLAAEAMLTDLEGNLDSAATLWQGVVNMTSVPNVKLRSRLYYADVLRREGKLDLAISELQKNLTTNPNHYRSLLLLADIYDSQGEHQSARSYRQRVMELWADADPDFKPMVMLRKQMAGEVALVPGKQQS
jgi:tetratricopeptide (TPR) repeat protein